MQTKPRSYLWIEEMFRDVFVLILLYQFITFSVVAQPRPYISVAGGVGSYTNAYDASLLNSYNPRREGLDIGIAIGRGKRSGFGWETGVNYRVVRYRSASLQYGASGMAVDTVDLTSDYTFLLIPLWLTYTRQVHNVNVGVRVGLYTGWKTSGQEKLTHRLNPNVVYYGFASGSRFPTVDTFGGQAGATIAYQISPRLALGVEGILGKDASDLIHPNSPLQPSRIKKIPTRFSSYNARIVHLSVYYYL